MAITPLNIYEINTVPWLNGLSHQNNRPYKLNDVQENIWDELADMDFNAVWLMGVWRRSPQALRINKEDSVFLEAMKQVLPDFNVESDLIGSAYSIQDYKVSELIGDHYALTKVKSEINKRGMKLILDYVPNHVAPDNPWAASYPEFFLSGSSEELGVSPASFIRVGVNVYAKGKDPEYAPWSDVVQLNAFSNQLRQAVIDLLLSIAKVADGVRCDMAMLMLTRVFSNTWGGRGGEAPAIEYWQEIITAVKKHYPNFIFIAESYWQTQDELLALGFDYCYDKDFLDHLKQDNLPMIKSDLGAPLSHQRQLIRFLENHDEDRAAASLDQKKHRLALLILETTPASKLFYDGQSLGKRIRTPVQLIRDPYQSTDLALERYYKDIGRLKLLIGAKISDFTMLKTDDSVLAWVFNTDNEKVYLVACNYSPVDCRVATELYQPYGSIRELFNSFGENFVEANIVGQLVTTKLKAYQGVIFELMTDAQ